MKAIGSSVLAVLAGAVVAMVLIAAVAMIGSMAFLPPLGLDLHDPEAIRQHIDSLPSSAFLLVLVGWALGVSGGAWVAAKLAGRARLAHGLIVGALLLVASIGTMLMIPHPIWMWFGAILALGRCSYLGARFAAATPPARATT